MTAGGPRMLGWAFVALDGDEVADVERVELQLFDRAGAANPGAVEEPTARIELSRWGALQLVDAIARVLTSEDRRGSGFSNDQPDRP